MTTLQIPLPEPPPRVAPDLLDLFAAAIELDPDLAPPVVDGSSDMETWFTCKQPSWSATRYNADRLVGHISVRKHARGPGNLPLPPGRTWELMRLVVHPDRRRHGVAADLVGETERYFGAGLWATVCANSPSHRLLAARGWVNIAETTWYERPGALVLAYVAAP